MITQASGALGQAIYASTVVKSQLDTLTSQVSTGYVSADLAGLGTGAQTVVGIAPQIAQLTAQQSAIGAVTGRLGVTQAALTQITTIASTFNAQLSTLNALTPTAVDNVAAQAKTALQQVASLLNTQDGGVYVFGGTNSAVAPVPDADTILSSGLVTQIGAAVAALGTNGQAATSAATLAIASSNAPGTTPFAGPPGQAPTLDAGTGGLVPVGLLANANTLAVSTGTSTTGSYTRDILRGLATLAGLSSSQVSAAGFLPLVQDTGACLSGAISAIGQEAGELGNIQSALSSAQAQQADVATVLTKQVSDVRDVNTAQAISQLTQVQTELSASYKLISEVSSLSLLQYL